MENADGEWPQPTMPPGFERRTPLDPRTPCWPWPIKRQRSGYGKLSLDGQTKYPHRVSYRLHVGPIPPNAELDHVCHSLAILNGTCAGGITCEHRLCWNPEHLEAVSQGENKRRGGHPLVLIHRSPTCRRGHDLSDPAVVKFRRDGRRRCHVCDEMARLSREGRA